MAKAETPWGAAEVLEQLRLPQRSGERRFESIVQLLETAKGERLVRFAYATGGTARRGPVTLRAKDLERLRSSLAEHPALAEALGIACDPELQDARLCSASVGNERSTHPNSGTGFSG
jgi:hypothetical protein